MKTFKAIISGFAMAFAMIGSAQATLVNAEKDNATEVSPFERNNKIVGDLLKNAMQGKFPEVPNTEFVHKPAPKENQEAVEHYQTGVIDGNIRSIRMYRGNKIPIGIQEEISKTFSPDYKDFQPYKHHFVLGNGKPISVPVRDLPIYVVAQMADGSVQSQIFYPRPMPEGSPGFIIKQ